MRGGEHRGTPRLRQGRRTSSRHDDDEGARAFTLTSADLARCPIGSLSPSHYREDGTCLCGADNDDEEPM